MVVFRFIQYKYFSIILFHSQIDKYFWQIITLLALWVYENTSFHWSVYLSSIINPYVHKWEIEERREYKRQDTRNITIVLEFSTSFGINILWRDQQYQSSPGISCVVSDCEGGFFPTATSLQFASYWQIWKIEFFCHFAKENFPSRTWFNLHASFALFSWNIERENVNVRKFFIFIG